MTLSDKTRTKDYISVDWIFTGHYTIKLYQHFSNTEDDGVIIKELVLKIRMKNLRCADMKFLFLIYNSYFISKLTLKLKNLVKPINFNLTEAFMHHRRIQFARNIITISNHPSMKIIKVSKAK